MPSVPIAEKQNTPHAKWAPSTGMLLALIMLLAAWFRIDAALQTEVDHPIRADAARYVAYAYNIRHFSTYSKEKTFVDTTAGKAPTPDAFVAPGYPALLSLLMEDTPDWDFIRRVILVQALLGLLLIPLTYFVGTRMMPARWALLPAALVAISPKLITAGTYLLTEILFTTLLLASIAWIIASTRHSHSIWAPLLGGVLLASTALVRPTLQYILPFILIAVIPVVARGFRLKYAVWMVFGFCLISGSWAMRNVIATGHKSDPTLAISTLVHGHYPFMMYDSQPESFGYPYRFDPENAQLSQSIPTAVRGITRRVGQSPAQYLQWYLFGKPVYFLSWSDPAAVDGIFTYPVRSSPYQHNPAFKISLLAMRYSHWLWITLFLVAIATVAVPRLAESIPVPYLPTLRVTSAIGLYFILVHMAGFPIARYNIPILPVIFLLAGYAMHLVLNKRGARQPAPAT